MKVNHGQRRRERLDRGIKVRSDGIYALMSGRELCYLVLPRAVLIVGMLLGRLEFFTVLVVLNRDFWR